MKVIDLINKIANKEIEDGFKFKISDYEYFIENNRIYYVNDYGTTCEIKQIKFMCLNDKVEIIEEKPKRIEEYKQNINLASSTNQEQAVKIFKYLCDFADKINELTKATNYLLEKSDSE